MAATTHGYQIPQAIYWGMQETGSGVAQRRSNLDVADDDDVCFLESRGHRKPGSRITRSAVAFEIILAGLIGMEQVSRFTLEVREQLAIMCCLCYRTALGILPTPFFQHAVNRRHTCCV